MSGSVGLVAAVSSLPWKHCLGASWCLSERKLVLDASLVLAARLGAVCCGGLVSVVDMGMQGTMYIVIGAS